jgi:hypothetical protein
MPFFRMEGATMRKPAASLASLFLILASPAAAQDAAGAPIFRALIERRIAAIQATDVAAYMALLDKDYVAISDLGARKTLADIPAHVTGADPTRRYEIRSLNVRAVMGDLAIVDAEIGEDMVDAMGGWRESDIFVRRDGRWLYLHRQDTALLQAPAPAPMKNEALEDYAGLYRSARGTTDIFTVKDGTLYGRSKPEDVPTALVHVAQEMFSIPGMPDLLIFLRDSSGKVTGFADHLTSGQVIPSERVGPR